MARQWPRTYARCTRAGYVNHSQRYISAPDYCLPSSPSPTSAMTSRECSPRLSLASCASSPRVRDVTSHRQITGRVTLETSARFVSDDVGPINRQFLGIAPRPLLLNIHGIVLALMSMERFDAANVRRSFIATADADVRVLAARHACLYELNRLAKQCYGTARRSFGLAKLIMLQVAYMFRFLNHRIRNALYIGRGSTLLNTMCKHFVCHLTVACLCWR